MGTYTQLIYQIVFCAKYRAAFLREESQDQLFAYIGGVIRKMGCTPHIVGGYNDHLHIVYAASGKYSTGNIVKQIKVSSSSFIKDRPDLFPGFKSWQVGYGAFTYNKSDLNRIINYVKNQKSHHTQKSFEKEFIQFLEDFDIHYELQHLFS